MTKDEAWKMIEIAIDYTYYAQDIMEIKEALALTSTQCEKQPAQEPEYLYRVDVSRREEGECTKYDHPLYFHNNADANNYCWAINQAPRKRSSIVIAESCAIKMGTISPQRPWGKPWVSLTGEDVLKAYEETKWDEHNFLEYEKRLEDIMKEKNGVSSN